jgi:hypothetical protein
MSGPQFTRGPWELGGALVYAPQGERTAGRSQGSSISIALMLRRPAIYGGRVQRTQDTDCDACETGAQVDANARLIAAAPDLYAALERTLRALEQHLDDQCIMQGLKHRDDLCPCNSTEVVEARSALARARGEVQA